MTINAALEALLFVAGDDGLAKEELARILEIDKAILDNYLNELENNFKNENRGLELEFYGSRVKIITKKEYKKYLQKLFTEETSENLSASALETLAIIAYNEPVTRSVVDEIRGVSSAHIIRKLVFKNLVKDVGRSEQPGRPILYGVTEGFLDHFGLSSTKDLPKLAEVKKEEEPQDLFDSKYKEI